MAGGGNPFRGYSSPNELAAELRKEAEGDVDATAFRQQVSTLLSDQLFSANNRDAKLARERLDGIVQTLGNECETSFDMLFGGSVAKRTYVDGLSDVDTLVILNNTDMEKATPAEALKRFAEIVRAHAPGAVVTTGAMAVSMEYPDGMLLQLLPAIRTATGVRVPAENGTEWSSITKPEKFRDALTGLNEKCGGRLVPVIKLAKTIMGAMPESQRLSGYHMESLSIEAFKDYSGPYTTETMLPRFFEQARTLVLKPIIDSTGQSRHVDDYLGAAESPNRRDASHLLDRVAKRMNVANATQSIQQWKTLFGESE